MFVFDIKWICATFLGTFSKTYLVTLVIDTLGMHVHNLFLSHEVGDVARGRAARVVGAEPLAVLPHAVRTLLAWAEEADALVPAAKACGKE
jgi:hypothetical protein